VSCEGRAGKPEKGEWKV